MGWLSVSVQMYFAMGLWWKIYLPFISALTQSFPFPRCSQLLLDLVLFITAVCRQSWAEPYGTSGSTARWLQQQKGNGDKVVLANSCPFFKACGLSWLVMVGSLASSETVNTLWLWIGWALDFLPVCKNQWLPVKLEGSRASGKMCIILQSTLEVYAVLYLAG